VKYKFEKMKHSADFRMYGGQLPSWIYNKSMEPIEQEKELQQLKELYSSMADAELQELAEDSVELTDSARTVLRDEIKRRGLKIVLEEPSTTTDPIVELELTTIRKFRDLPEALLAKGLLESAGIECSIADDTIVRLDWFVSNAIGNMRLQVKQSDAEAATELLDQPAPAISEDEASD
jgi:hypothetical protein